MATSHRSATLDKFPMDPVRWQTGRTFEEFVNEMSADPAAMRAWPGPSHRPCR